MLTALNESELLPTENFLSAESLGRTVSSSGNDGPFEPAWLLKYPNYAQDPTLQLKACNGLLGTVEDQTARILSARVSYGLETLSAVRHQRRSSRS